MPAAVALLDRGWGRPKQLLETNEPASPALRQGGRTNVTCSSKCRGPNTASQLGFQAWQSNHVNAIFG